MFVYQISFWEDEQEVCLKQSGIVAAADYGEAATKIVEYYGKTNFCEFHSLIELDHYPVALPAAIVQGILNDDYVIQYDE